VAKPINFMAGSRWKLLLTCAVVSVITLSGVFFFLDRRQESLYLESMNNQARALFQQVVFTRKWIADHGGVFVEQLPWVSPNPYLKEKSVTATTGRKYIKKNPAMVTRELSDYSRKQGAYWFHITSLRPINPANAPDEFEEASLKAFEESRLQDAWDVLTISRHKYFRYIAPLFVEESCMECHSHQGYKVGDIRGGISVSLPLDKYYASLQKERTIMAAFTVSVALILMAVLYIALNKVLVVPIRQLRDFALSWKESATAPSSREEPYPECPDSMALSPGDEIYDLYNVLCSLRSSVTSHQRDLQGRISEATAEMARMNEQLLDAGNRYKDASEQKSRFIAGLSHELRTPLTSIKGAAGYISEKLQDREFIGSGSRDEIAPFLEIINRNINRFVKLVEDTLDLEKVEAGQMELHLAEVDMGEMLEEARREFMPMASGNEVTISTSAKGSPFAMADPDRIFQVISNLVINALRHSPRGAALRLEASRSGPGVLVSVSDEGPGIPGEEMEKVFELFHKGSKDGTGIGLTISKRIVESHGGALWVEQCSPKGSTFCFTLPLAGAGEPVAHPGR
jgi:signal transduction histidine kinase